MMFFNQVTFNMKTIIFALIFTFLLYACSGSTELKDNRTAYNYVHHLKQTPATFNHEVKNTFEKIFHDFKTGATEFNIRSVYADKFYFNDTFKIIENIDELVAYMLDSASHVNSTTVEVHEVIAGEQDYYIRWSMKMDLTVKHKHINSYSIGMTQLRFNEQGKVVFHQDFWDSSEAFYEHLPLLGYWLKKVKKMM